MNNSTDRRVANHFDSIAEIYADSYKNESFFSYYFARRLEIIFGFLESFNNAKVLDVGCGPGMMAEYSSKRNFEFFGIDISEKMIAKCINDFGHIDSNHFSVGKLQNLKFPDSFFDVVLCMGALEYIDKDEVNSAVAEMSRVLKPDGLIIISLMHEKSFFAQIRRLESFVKEKITRREYFAESYDYLSRSFDESSFRDLLKLSQLENDIQTIFFGLNILPPFLEKRIPEKLKVKIAKWLDNIIKGRLKWPYIAFIVKAKKQADRIVN